MNSILDTRQKYVKKKETLERKKNIRESHENRNRMLKPKQNEISNAK